MKICYTAETGLTEKPFSILYVEDEQTTREIVAARLSRQYPGARIDTAENGAAGLEMFKELNYSAWSMAACRIAAQTAEP